MVDNVSADAQLLLVASDDSPHWDDTVRRLMIDPRQGFALGERLGALKEADIDFPLHHFHRQLFEICIDLIQLLNTL